MEIYPVLTIEIYPVHAAGSLQEHAKRLSKMMMGSRSTISMDGVTEVRLMIMVITK